MTEPDRPAGEPSDVVHTALEIETRLAESTEFADTVSLILASRLNGAITPETLGLTIQSLTEYAGPDVATFIAQALVIDEFEIAFEEDDRAAFQPRVTDWLHLLRALFRNSGVQANLRSGQRPDDWMYFSREVMFDQLRDAWIARMTIEKYNGSQFMIEGSANAPLNLVRELLILMQSFPTREVFGSVELSQMANELAAFEAKFGRLDGDASLSAGPAAVQQGEPAPTAAVPAAAGPA